MLLTYLALLVVIVLPQGYRLSARPPRAAYSHSASVGRRLPAHVAYACASCHVTLTIGRLELPQPQAGAGGMGCDVSLQNRAYWATVTSFVSI